MTAALARPIVVGVDGGPYGRAALRWALEEGARRDCPVHAITVFHGPPVMSAGQPTSVGFGAALPGTAVEQKAMMRLERTVRDVLGEQDNPRLAAELVQGNTGDTLCSASEGAELLVLGSHGHDRLFEAIVGSVSQHCVRYAHCPVVVIPGQLVEAPAVGDQT